MALLNRLFGRSPAAAEAKPADQAPVPAWHALALTFGVQLGDYPDAPRPEILPLLDHAPARVLDIGCATGAVGAAIKKEYGAWVWGCELDAEAARRAALRLDHVSVRTFSEWDAEEMALLGTVDTVLLLDVLEHMYNPWQQLEFLAEHLPGGAQVIASIPNLGNLQTLLGLARGRFDYEREGVLDVTHIRFFTPASMQAMFVQTGFRVEKCQVLSEVVASVEPTEYPARIDLGDMVVLARSPEHWTELKATQLGLRARVA